MGIRAGDVVRLKARAHDELAPFRTGTDSFRGHGEVIGPEKVGSSKVLVRWQPSGVISAWDPEDLEVMEARGL